jgi:hypothetical protein
LAASLVGCATEESGSDDAVEAADDEAAPAAPDDEPVGAALPSEEAPEGAFDGVEAPESASVLYHGHVMLEYTLGTYSQGWNEVLGCTNHVFVSTLFPHTNTAPHQVYNGCPTRVWVYQWLNHTGYQRCISPNSVVTLSARYKSLYLSRNPAKC